MINKMKSDLRKIKAPEYAYSQERQNLLRNMVIDGKDAQAVQKYADAFLKECETALLKYAKEGKTELMNQAALDYRVAFQFCEMLKHAADMGAKKEEILRNTRL